MTGGVRALARLLAVQACWSYERMQGIGMAWGTRPLLEPLRERDPARLPAATARAGEFFNAHPYLAGVAAGAGARAELDGESPDAIHHVRLGLSGPLGALGDRVFWAGSVPTMMAVALIGVALGGSTAVWWVALALLAHNALRLWTGRWALQVGWRHGLGVRAAIASSWLPRGAAVGSRAAALATGAAVPIAAVWLLGEAPRTHLGVAAGAVGLGIVLGPRLGSRLSALWVTLGLLGVTLIWQWGFV